MKLGNWVCTYNTRRAAPCGPLSRRSAWLCFPTPRLPPSLQVRSYTSGSSRHRFSPIEVCSQAVEPARRRQPLRPPLGPAMPSYHARRRTVRTPPAQLRAIRPIALRFLPTRRRRLSDSPALPAHRQTEPSAPALVFFTSRAAAAVPRAAAHSAPVPTTRVHRRAPSIPTVTPPHRLPMPPCRPLRFARPVDCRSLAASRVATPTPSPTSARAAPAHRRCR